MSADTGLNSFLSAQLANDSPQWSLGTFGAIAEFARDAGEPVTYLQGKQSASAVTPRGGIRIVAHPELRLFASESATRESWSHRVSLCLPAASGVMHRRSVLTELGPDMQALRAEDQNAVLFDLGLDAVQLDACIRVFDPVLLAKLRSCTGRPAFDHDNPAMGHILAASPHRVFLSRIGRIEVFQPIPPPNGRSPEGPHTHVLPKLLQHKRTHAATEPVPEGFVPCAHLYPAHPMKNALGRPVPFDERRHEIFQDMLGRFGDADAITLKRQAMNAITEGRDPSAVAVPNDRFARSNIRVAVRQMRALQRRLSALPRWIAAYDHAQGTEDEVDQTEAMHG
jgi:hypothetical protein